MVSCRHEPVYSIHGSPAAWSSSRIVGSKATGVLSNAPPFGSGAPLYVSAGSGTQAGTSCTAPPSRAAHSVTLLLSHPHPSPDGTPRTDLGVSPRKPSRVLVMAYRWPPQEGLSPSENVASEIANPFANAVRLGSCRGRYPL